MLRKTLVGHGDTVLRCMAQKGNLISGQKRFLCEPNFSVKAVLVGAVFFFMIVLLLNWL